MFTLDNFYKSDEWETLLKVLKDERKNEKDLVICEHCGKPIVKKYDCIGHHVKELTEDNVNDYNISLNPENIMLIHHKCHNEIHRRFGFEKKKKVYVVYGSPCSGKMDYVHNISSPNDLVIDLDNIYQMISTNKRYTNVKTHTGFALEVKKHMLSLVKNKFGKWQDCYIVGGYPLRRDREELERELKAELIFIESTKEECLQRMYERFNDTSSTERYTKYIDEWFDRYY